MTTICAVQGSGWALIGWDSRVAEDSTRVYSVSKGSNKVTRNGAYLIGVAGDVRAINIVTYVFTPPRPGDLSGTRLDRFVTREFIPAMRQCFEDEGYLSSNREKPEEHGSQIIVVVNGSVYEIGGDWAWVRDESGLYAIGSGSDCALGALAMSDVSTAEQARRSVMQALKVSARFDQGTGAPFHTAMQLGLR